MARSFIAELLISHPDLPLAPTIRAVPSVTIEVEAQPLTATTDEDRPTIFFTLMDAAERCDRDFESALSRDRTVDDWTVVLELADCRTYKIRLGQNAKVTSPKITGLGVRILSIRNAADDWRLRLQAPDKESLGAYWRYCRDEDIQFTLEKLYSSRAQARPAEDRRIEARLTDRQREVARTATRMGYYESDGASAKAVATELDISRSTLSTHLRRIAAKLFRETFGE
ncbi:helix-turn-helix domain-containing protein [Natrinema sp. 74]|uniref:helix-turn-helix domain-containing protein n=1 Tax=Natrinema sp. 74 TaxID=3384159 RepID=UPI0038D46A53